MSGKEHRRVVMVSLNYAPEQTGIAPYVTGGESHAGGPGASGVGDHRGAALSRVAKTSRIQQLSTYNRGDRRRTGHPGAALRS